MGFHYEDAASQWWRRRTLSAKAPYSRSFEMRCPSTRTLSKRSAAEWATVIWLAKRGRPPNERSMQARMRDW